ncbi:MAG: hypothetical protein RIC55_25785 [Pirellulaceae bacterium]
MAIEKNLDPANQQYVALNLFGKSNRRLRMAVRCRDGRLSLWVSNSDPGDSDGWQIILPSLDALPDAVNSGALLHGTTPGRTPYWGDGQVKPRELVLAPAGPNVEVMISNPEATSGERITLVRQELASAIDELTAALSGD